MASELERLALYADDDEKRRVMELWGAKFTRLQGGRKLRAMVWMDVGEAEKPQRRQRRRRRHASPSTEELPPEALKVK